ncbi:MAG TPA: hypothetical protein VIK62_02400 [Verrucomicrobiae bacterium]
MPPADTESLRIEFTDKSTLPKLLLIAKLESTNETVSESPLTVDNFDALLETHSTERMSFTASLILPSSAD